ncbi:hypothetical protein V8F06_012622, partial [Rhypophila decipiens]
MLGFLALYIGSDKSSDTWITYDTDKLWVAKHLLPVARSIHQANIITSFSVLVAAVIRSSMDLFTVGERQFMNKLAIFEILICWICTLPYLPLHASSMLERFTLLMCMVVSLYLWMGSDTGLSDKTLEAIASWCFNHGSANSSQVINDIDQILHLPSRMVNIDGGETGPNALILFFVVLPSGTLWFVAFSLFVFGRCFGMQSQVEDFYIALAQIIIWGLTWPFLEASRFLNFGPRRLGALAIVFSLGSVATVFVWLLLEDLLATRRQMQVLAGDKYEDNRWGFGQIAAVMTWVPVVQEVLFAIIRTVKYYRSVAEACQHDTNRVAPVGLLAGRDNMHANGQQTMEMEELATQPSSEEHSGSDSELLPPPHRATRSNTHSE